MYGPQQRNEIKHNAISIPKFCGLFSFKADYVWITSKQHTEVFVCFFVYVFGFVVIVVFKCYRTWISFQNVMNTKDCLPSIHTPYLGIYLFYDWQNFLHLWMSYSKVKVFSCPWNQPEDIKHLTDINESIGLSHQWIVDEILCSRFKRKKMCRVFYETPLQDWIMQSILLVLVPHITAVFSSLGVISLPRCRKFEESCSAPRITTMPQPMPVKIMFSISSVPAICIGLNVTNWIVEHKSCRFSAKEVW